MSNILRISSAIEKPCFLTQDQKARIRKAQKVISLKNDEVLAFVEDDDEPEWIALEDIDISEAEHLESPEETLPVFTLDECFSTSWEFIQTQLDFSCYLISFKNVIVFKKENFLYIHHSVIFFYASVRKIILLYFRS